MSIWFEWIDISIVIGFLYCYTYQWLMLIDLESWFSFFIYLFLSYWLIGLEKGDGVGFICFGILGWIKAFIDGSLMRLGDGGNAVERRGEVRQRRWRNSHIKCMFGKN